MAKLTRRAALAALGTGAGLLGLGFILRNLVDIPMSHAGQGFGGADGMDMSKYTNMFMRHTELRRNVEDIPEGCAPPRNPTLPTSSLSCKPTCRRCTPMSTMAPRLCV